jgi:hypothetical protein
MFSSFLHVVACIITSFFYSFVWICHILLIHSPVDDYLGVLQLEAIMCNIAMSIPKQVWMDIWLHFGYVSDPVILLWCHYSVVFTYVRHSNVFNTQLSKGFYAFLFLPIYNGFNYSITLSILSVIWLFDSGDLSECEVFSYFGFDL